MEVRPGGCVGAQEPGTGANGPVDSWGRLSVCGEQEFAAGCSGSLLTLNAGRRPSRWGLRSGGSARDCRNAEGVAGGLAGGTAAYRSGAPELRSLETLFKNVFTARGAQVPPVPAERGRGKFATERSRSLEKRYGLPPSAEPGGAGSPARHTRGQVRSHGMQIDPIAVRQDCRSQSGRICGFDTAGAGPILSRSCTEFTAFGSPRLGVGRARSVIGFLDQAMGLGHRTLLRDKRGTGASYES